MAEQITPEIFRKSGEYIVSYDFLDYIQNQGFARFYIGNAYDNTGASANILSRNTFESMSQLITDTGTQGGGLTSDYTKIGDHDYDIEIGSTQIIDGKAIAELTWTFRLDQGSGAVIGGSDTTGSGYIVVKIRKWDGTTETEIGYGKTFVSSQSVNSGNEISVTYRNSLVLDCTATKFNRGDFIRVTVETWANMTAYRFANDTAQVKYYTDPMDRNAYAVNYGKPTAESEVYAYASPTNFNLKIPFRLVN